MSQSVRRNQIEACFGALRRSSERYTQTLRSIGRKQVYPLGYSASFDGWRALATIVVLLYHVDHSHQLLPGAMIVLDFFFALSGYFVTSLLLREYDRTGTVQIGRFLTRRAMRLLPPAVMMCATVLAIRGIFELDGGVTLNQIAATISIPFRMVWETQGPFEVPPGFIHLWTISVEIKYYLIWTVIFWVLVRLVGVSWWLFAGSVSLAIVVWVTRTWMYWNDYPQSLLIFEIYTHGDSLLIGDAVAIALRLIASRPAVLFDRILRALVLPVALGSALFLLVPDAYAIYLSGWSLLIGPVNAAIQLLILIRLRGTILHRLYELPMLVAQGRIFYGLYLWHIPVYGLVDLLGVRDNFALRAILGIPLCYAAATFSYFTIERYFMRLRSST